MSLTPRPPARPRRRSGDPNQTVRPTPQHHPARRVTDVKDPIQRALRIISFFAFLGLLVVVVIDPTRSDLALDLMLIGAILLQVGYDVIVPGLTARNGRAK